MHSRRALALTLLTLGALPPAGAAAQAPATPCTDVAPGATCGELQVPLDRSGATAGSQTVGYAVLPATGTRVGTLAVVLGGPGQASTVAAREVATALAALRGDFDLLLVDQRGTGRSGALTCASLSRGLTPGSVRACGEELGARRAFFTTRADAEDLEDVRAALGIERLRLLGVSYGTNVAGYYARLHPDRVERMILDSPVPIEGIDGLETLRQLALPRVLRELCFPPGCQGVLPRNPVTGVATLARRLAGRSLRGTVVTPGGRRVPARLTSNTLYALTAASDVDPFLRSELPAAIASGLRGDPAPLLRLFAGVAGTGSSEAAFNTPRLLATSCVESRLPWDPASDTAGRAAALLRAIAARPASAWAPFSPDDVVASSEAAVCQGWPPTPAPTGVAQQGPQVPVLVISGRDDLRTPLEDARRTASQYPGAQVLAVPAVAHSVLSGDISGCAVDGTVAFLAGKPAQKCTAFPRVPELLPYIPANASSLIRTARLPGVEGRTATALGATLFDAVHQAGRAAEAGGRRIGGLRAGTLTIGSTRLTLRGYSVIRGIALTGTVPFSATGTGRLAVGGAAAAPGRLTLKGTRLTGRVGTHRVRLRVILPVGG